MNSRIASVIALLIGCSAPIAAAISAYGQESAEKTEIMAIKDEATTLNPHLLGFVYLATFNNGLWLRDVHKDYETVRNATTGEFTITVIAHTPDGKGEEFTLRTFEELNQFMAHNTRLLTAYEETINERGFAQLPSKYQVQFTQNCGEEWFSMGEISVEQDGFMLKISQDEDVFAGVALEETVTIIRPPSAIPTLIGNSG